MEISEKQSVLEQFLCPLCQGVLTDVHTIVECLHSFCKSCIFLFVQRRNICPVCDTTLDFVDPTRDIKFDPQLQDLVSKALPSIHSNEVDRRLRFFQSNGMAPRLDKVYIKSLSMQPLSNSAVETNSNTDIKKQRILYKEDKKVWLQLNSFGSEDQLYRRAAFYALLQKNAYIRSSSRALISDIKEALLVNITSSFKHIRRDVIKIRLFFGLEDLEDADSLKEIYFEYHGAKKSEPIPINYAILIDADDEKALNTFLIKSRTDFLFPDSDSESGFMSEEGALCIVSDQEEHDEQTEQDAVSDCELETKSVTQEEEYPIYENISKTTKGPAKGIASLKLRLSRKKPSDYNL